MDGKQNKLTSPVMFFTPSENGVKGWHDDRILTNELFSASITSYFDIFTKSVQYAVNTP